MNNQPPAKSKMVLPRKPAQQARDRRNIAAMYLRGKTQQEIAKELKLSQATVSRDLKVIQGDWVEMAAQDLDQRKSIELAKVDALELEYWEAWARSQNDAETEISKTISRGGDGTGTTTEQQKRIEGQVGDPRYLSGIMQCIERRCTILGIDAPKKIDATSDGKPIGQFDFEQWKKDRAKRLEEVDKAEEGK